MTDKDKLNLDQYVILRKLISDIAWYRKTGRIDELVVQVEKHTGRKVPIHNNDKNMVMKKIESDHKAGASELVSSMSKLSDVSEDTVDSLKIWSDMCFYINNPRMLDYLCASTFNDGTNIEYGPLVFHSNDISDKEALHGDGVRRMLYYPKLPVGEDGDDFIFFTTAGTDVGAFYSAFKNGTPIDENDAVLMYDMYQNQYLERLYANGMGENPHSWESDTYKYYSGMDFDVDDMLSYIDADISVKKQPEDICLATHMSRLSASIVSQPEDIRKKNEFVRGIFDVVMQTGNLPAAITHKNTGKRQTIREFVDKYGAETLLPVLDAAYYMSSNKYDRKMFSTQRKVCDTFAVKQEIKAMTELRQKEWEDEKKSFYEDPYITDDSFGVREIDESEIPSGLDLEV